MVLLKQRKYWRTVKQSGTTIKRALSTSRVRKNSSSMLNVFGYGKKKAASGSLPKEWTPARKHSFIVSVLRQGTRRWPAKYLTLNAAKTEKRINPASKRLAQFYLCAGCAGEFPAKEISIDHIHPVVGPDGFTTWDEYVNRMYCEADNMQALCRTCHGIKTKAEKGERNKNRSQTP